MSVNRRCVAFMLAFSTCCTCRGFTSTIPRVRKQSSVSPLRLSGGDDSNTSDRRRFLVNALSTSTFVAAVVTQTSSIPGSSAASAYEQTYPVELSFANGDTSRDLSALRDEAYRAKKKSYETRMDYVTDKNPLLFRGPKDVLTCAVWGGALWLLSGSRSNPLVTPLANAFYDQEDQDWLKDRNEGLFASLPLPFFGVLIVVFFVLGIATDRIILFLAEGSSNVSLQLAGVSLISGASLELGRLASGEKGPTRQEFDRSSQLRQEFEEFASKRLKLGGNCHRNDVVRAFRRFYAKYRQEESVEYPLTNLEIEKLLREWTRSRGGFAEMSSAGFYNGLSINEQADIFTQR
ncbi:hypothetical protein MHU86_3608 [Fragilaria crotonensis]|nr:hypothetical protein MHU86_3608 [Fragilaria crotonensis]